ncbi:MAG: hypothetical protein AAGF12_12795 [Myxococcota bacterium]
MLRSTIVILAALVLGLIGCGDDSGGGGDTPPGSVSRGGACTADRDCEIGLACVMGICDFAGNGTPGSPCTYTSECGPDLYCSDPRVCQPTGSGGVDGECENTDDCEKSLVCEPTANGRRCVSAADQDIDDPCLRRSQCLAGLFCYATDGASRCRGVPPTAPVDGGNGDGGRDSSFEGGVVPCQNRDACDDNSMCTVDTCINGFCVYNLVDSDDDGYASKIIGSCGLDCNDEEPRANPDQTEFFTVRHTGDLVQPSTFDWDCNGVQEGQFPTLPICDDDERNCPAATVEGFRSDPGCGMSGTWARCEVNGNRCNVVSLETRVQGCR